MPRTDLDEHYDETGALVRQTERIVPDDALHRDGARTRARSAYADLRALRAEAATDRAAVDTSGLTAAQRGLLRRLIARQQRLIRVLADIELVLGLDDGSYTPADGATE